MYFDHPEILWSLWLLPLVAWLLVSGHRARAPVDNSRPWREVLMAWALLPLHGDLLATAVSSLEWLGLGLAAYYGAKNWQKASASSAARFSFLICDSAV